MLVESSLAQRQYASVSKNRIRELIQSVGEPAYARNVVQGINLFGSDMKRHYLIYHPEKWSKGLAIEVRWQGVSGSAYEKFPFFVMNIKKSCIETVILLDGPGLKPDVIDWVKRQTGYRLIEALNRAEFQSWVNQGNL